jgi:hypothetical protein
VPGQRVGALHPTFTGGPSAYDRDRRASCDDPADIERAAPARRREAVRHDAG